MAKPGIDLEDEDALQKTSNLDLDEEEGGGSTRSRQSDDDDDDDDDAEFGNTDDYRRAGELDMIKIDDKGRFKRFSFIAHPQTGKAVMKKAWIHYQQNKGYAKCLSTHDAKGGVTKKEFCCKGKDAERRFVALIVEYLSIDPKTGSFIADKPVEFEVKAIALSTSSYKDISMLVEEDEKVTNLDIIGTPDDKSKGKKYARKARKASYTKDPALLAAVLEAAKPFLDGDALKKKCGKSLNAAEMRVHLGITTAGDDGDDNLDDL